MNISSKLIEQVKQARERLNHKGMILTHDKKTDRLIKFRIKYRKDVIKT